MTTQTDLTQLSAVASRLREMREIMGWTAEEMAEKTEVSADEYLLYEAGQTDMPFTFIYKAAQVFNMEWKSTPNRITISYVSGLGSRIIKVSIKEKNDLG